MGVRKYSHEVRARAVDGAEAGDDRHRRHAEHAEPADSLLKPHSTGCPQCATVQRCAPASELWLEETMERRYICLLKAAVKHRSAGGACVGHCGGACSKEKSD